MNVLRRPAAIAITALALTALPYTAEAHDGSHPFENCSEAYANGYAHISADDEHYGAHLDRDKDGIGCDKPPADFVPAEDEGEDKGAGGGEADSTEDTSNTSPDTAGQQDPGLAATGGSSATPYIAGGGAAVLLAGGGVLVAARRRRAAR